MKLAWGGKVSNEFARKAIRIANEFGFPPNDFMSCMAFESAETFSPSIRNPKSSATGLIQFMRDTAKQLGTTVEALARMTAVEQLDYVRKYFLPYKGKLKTIDDLYMAILWPKAVGKPSSYVLFDRDSDKTTKAYFANKGLDVNQNGQITKGEAAAQPRLKLSRGLKGAFVREIEIDEPTTFPSEPEDAANDDAPLPIPAPRPRPDGRSSVTADLQRDLKAMNYYTARIDGTYGGRLAGAIAGFLNDWDERDYDLTAPKSADEYEAMRDDLVREVGYAMDEGFKRPVTKERAEADPEIVEEVAPDTIPQKRGVVATAWGAILAFLAGLWDTFSGYLYSAWTWFTGNRDAIPDEAVGTGVSFLHKIPPGVWLFVVCGILAFVSFGLIAAVRRTVDDVRTGRR